ncbi:MAG: hypothetical protein J6X11_13935 [Treponema sp.]|nr:hypothetical protein [Treponema sp.]
MNTIPSIFNQRQINHTVMGGAEQSSDAKMPVDCIVLNRTDKISKSRIFDNLIYHGFNSIISVEAGSNRFATENVASLYPKVMFVVALEEITSGDMLNLGMSLATAPYVLVLQDDMCMEDISFNPQLAKKLIALNDFCVCPRLTTSSFQSIPVRFSPTVEKSVFNVASSLSIQEGAVTLYPADLAGFYDRNKYIQLGGADYTITSPYWQKMDLFFRAWLWGERVSLQPSFNFSYAGDIPEENQTVDSSYLRFYIKNLLPVFKNDHAEIPLTSFIAFRANRSCSFRDALELFGLARKWTEKNKYRFKKDAATLIQDWGK